MRIPLLCLAGLIASAPVQASAAASVTVAAAPDDGAFAALGRKLFFDPSLSASGQLSCATCHDPKRAYGPPAGKAIAFGGSTMSQSGTRAVPSLRYLRSSPPFALDHRFIDGDIAPVGGFTWDGRAASIRDQAEIPLLAPNEMANGSPAAVIKKLAKTPYAAQFRAAFGPDIFKDPNHAFAAALEALASFQNTPSEFFPFTSRYDAFLRGEVELTEQEERGAALFKDPKKGNCASCHLTSSRGGKPPVFTDYDFANVGVPRNPRIPANADPSYFDLGLCGPQRSDLVGQREYCGFFRAPTLRNVAIRDAFFHNGAFGTLRELMSFYVERDLAPEKFYPRNPDGTVHKADDIPAGYPDTLDHDPPLDRGGSDHPALTDAEIDDVIAFLQTLTDADAVTPTAQHSAAPVSAAHPSAANTPTALDWHTPWSESHNAHQATTNPDEYAWRLFVALNWPASAQTRQPDPSAPFGADKPVVWEVWQNATDVYLEDGQDPGPWVTVRGPSTTPATQTRFETFSLKDISNARHIVAGKMVPLTTPAPTAKRLTELRMNRTAFEYIRARELYNLDGQLRMVAAGRPVNFPPTSTEIKASWRPIRPDERARYHTLEVRSADGTERLYGLTALHIVAKDAPQWFWATFEHVDNPTRPDADGWQLPSSDRFACRGESADCNRAPTGIGLEGTVWQNYRLRGTLTRFVDTANRPLLLANSELEAGMQRSSACITCHARSSLALVGGVPTRLPIFDTAVSDAAAKGAEPAAAAAERRGYVGLPLAQWFEDGQNAGKPLFKQLDFVWSLSKARPRRPPRET
jgi:cytochrome c peroxidase